MKKPAVIFIFVWIALALLVDILFAIKWGEAGTISATIQPVFHDHPALSFAAGFLMGHLFWQMKGKYS